MFLKHFFRSAICKPLKDLKPEYIPQWKNCILKSYKGKDKEKRREKEEKNNHNHKNTEKPRPLSQLEKKNGQRQQQ